ncbi:MAG: glycine cleavage system aminomethyltransferase GcvT [Gammaproteobacteria bacterium]|nr:glycine cleavage system aminomethyltransferase GcvT [Gammaproteobacteria bacterium]
MNDARENLLKTVLHGWHVSHDAKMVPFGGWDMPVQYPTGIIKEHLATRRNAGLFDVSHMGRFRVRGAGAEGFLNTVLTNNVPGLESGTAHYTFIATPDGGAVDDAYLYKLDHQDYLLVVNAANRDKDWRWLEEHDQKDALEMTDISEDVCMISLQGPHASTVLENVVDSARLPENKRNQLGTVTVEGHDIIVARTGYTGESVCFELFPPREFTETLWQKLIDAGAQAVGLGARDSLRLEAGLPLYGHELGEDPDGNEIPIFANHLARFAVAATDDHDYVGRAALTRQREAYARIRRGEATDDDKRVLSRLVQPVAVFGGRRPLRAGYKAYLEKKHVGYVTSGTSVPFARFYDQAITSTPSDEHDMRPIGLALLDADIRYRSDRPVVLEIEDDRGKRFEAELVEKNLWPSAPYARAYTGFEAPASAAKVNADELEERAEHLLKDAVANTHWRRTECINLIPSEQTTSAYVDRLCVMDPAGRYNEHKAMKALGPNAPHVRYYKGTAFIMEREEELKAALATFFNCNRVEPRVISGQMANDTVYDALKQYRNRHRHAGEHRPIARVLVHDLNKGGHLSAQVMGALKNYVAIDPRTGRPAVEHFPFLADNPHRIDAEAARELIKATRPELIVFGRSVIIHTEPVKEIAEFVHREFGKDNPQRPLIMYDGAHVLGLLGPHFQDPFAEGADIVTGSTHKTFFGPQRGVVLGNIEHGSPFEDLWRHIESRAFPGHVSNHHLGTLLGLLGATYEMLHFRDAYQQQVTRNAKSFARALHKAGLSLEGDGDLGYTQTHQVLLRGARAKGEYLSDLLEKNNIITNPQAYHDDPGFAAASGVRMGTQEMTRFGMKEDDFESLAALMAEIIGQGEDRPAGHWIPAVESFRAPFTEMEYCFPA